MAELAEIERIARDVVNANTVPDAVISVSSKDDLGWDGDPIVRVSVVLADDAMSAFGGEASLAVLTQINERLAEAGDERFPIIDYTTPSELAEENAAS